MKRLSRLLGLGLLAVCASHALATENYVWKNVRVGGGGYIPGIVFSRVEKGLAYLRSDMGGAYRWDDKNKVWLPLQDSMAESSYQGIESVAPDPIDPNVVYLAAGMYRGDGAAMLRSEDKGNSWKIFPVSFRMGGNDDGRCVGERLAIDPNHTSTLYFGSRYAGLQRSDDRGETWKPVENFPIKPAEAPKQGPPKDAGISFVLFDRTSGTKGSASKTIYAGSTVSNRPHLFRSKDAGETWESIETGPSPTLLPLKAELDDAGTSLYITYGNHIGPNGVTAGAVYRFDTKTDQWTDITPDKSLRRPNGGYCGISLDRQHPGTLAVATLDRWGPSDTVWRSTDNGRTWKDIYKHSKRDVSKTPFLYWGAAEPRLGWWMSALAIDPFNSDFCCYATGATIYATNEFAKVSAGQDTLWRPWVDGIEQTAIITLTSPASGPHLLSGFGDIAGFYHDNLDASPLTLYTNPVFGNTNSIGYAGAKPNVVVRSGTSANPRNQTLAYSEDSGKTWKPINTPAAESAAATAGAAAGNGRSRARGPTNPDPDAPLETSADGKTFIVMTKPPQLTRDFGKTWTKVQGLERAGRAIADRVDGNRWYAFDFEKGNVLTSTDGGLTFKSADTQGLFAMPWARPNNREQAYPLLATPDHAGDLWLVAGEGLFHSTNGGKTFDRLESDVKFEYFSFGKPAPGAPYPAMYAIAHQGDLRAIYRSIDTGKTWTVLNDPQHQWGRRFRCIAGDPRIYGRVYVGTDGRGILYGEPVGTAKE